MFKRILVPVDGSEPSNKALVMALQLARDAGGQVRLVHILEETAFLTGYDVYSSYQGDLLRVMRDTGQKVLDDAAAIAASAGVQAETMLFDNLGSRLGETVAQEASHWQADLIVTGTHGRRGFGRVLLGSGAEQIARLAPVPVLTVRSSEAEVKTTQAAAETVPV